MGRLKAHYSTRVFHAHGKSEFGFSPSPQHAVMCLRNVGKIGERLDAVELSRLDQRGNDSPLLSPRDLIESREAVIFTAQSNWTG